MAERKGGAAVTLLEASPLLEQVRAEIEAHETYVAKLRRIERLAGELGDAVADAADARPDADRSASHTAELAQPAPAAAAASPAEERPLEVVLDEYLAADEPETTSHAQTGGVEAEQPAAETPTGDAAAADRSREEGQPSTTRDAAAAGREAAAPAPPARPRPASAARERNEAAVLDALERLGELPQGSLCSHAGVAEGSITAVCRRLEEAQKIVHRRVPSGTGGRPRVMWRLRGQPTKQSYSQAPAKMDRHWSKQRAKAEAAEAAASTEPTLRERIIATLQDAAPHGLTMAHLCAAVPGQERQNDVEEKVRVMWQDNELVRRRDGTFAVGASAWRPADDDDEEAA